MKFFFLFSFLNKNKNSRKSRKKNLQLNFFKKLGLFIIYKHEFTDLNLIKYHTPPPNSIYFHFFDCFCWCFFLCNSLFSIVNVDDIHHWGSSFYFQINVPEKKKNTKRKTTFFHYYLFIHSFIFIYTV